MLINEVLRNIRVRSFFLGDNAVCEILMIFFEFSNSGWVSLTISEGVALFSVLKDAPEVVDLADINDEFAYPVKSLQGCEELMGKRVSAMYEYRINAVREGCIGVYMEIEGKGLSILESDGCLELLKGSVDFDDDTIYMSKIDGF